VDPSNTRELQKLLVLGRQNLFFVQKISFHVLAVVCWLRLCQTGGGSKGSFLEATPILCERVHLCERERTFVKVGGVRGKACVVEVVASI